MAISLHQDETQLGIGPSAINAYSRLSYTMWYALAEFIDNSTQSRLTYDSIIDDVLKNEGQPLIVEITYNRTERTLSINDNSIGMTKIDLIAALQIAQPTSDSRGRSRYGMGLKTAACWIGAEWKVITCEWGSGEEWTAVVDVDGVANNGKLIPLIKREVDKSLHYTHVVISKLRRNFHKKTEETIKAYLGAMYRFDIQKNTLRIIFNGEEIQRPEDSDFDTDIEGKLMKRDLPETMLSGGRKISGWVGVLRKGGRKFGGFSLFQNERQIQGFPSAWKPKMIFGGVDDEGANNLISQRLTGNIELDGFLVSHTKDQILFADDEEERLEKLLFDETKDLRLYAIKRRGEKAQPWDRAKLKDLVDGMKKEFVSGEMKDAFNHSMLPPLETLLANKSQQVAALSDAEELTSFELLPNLRIKVSLVEKSEHEPYLVIAVDATPGVIHIILNGLHPYYGSLESTDAVDECIRQYIYDAISEYRASMLNAKLTPDTVKRIKDQLLRVQAIQIDNAAAVIREKEYETVVEGLSGS